MIESIVFFWKHEEDIAKDAHEPLGQRIVLALIFDASLMHDILSRKAVTGVCTFYNKTPVDWYCAYCKQKSISEIDTYSAN